MYDAFMGFHEMLQIDRSKEGLICERRSSKAYSGEIEK